MKNILLFDWGDTLMVDFPDQKGKMCNWDSVEAVEGAMETLKALYPSNLIYVATGAADSTPEDIKAAFERVDLNRFISGYFCQDNLGLPKGTSNFYQAIIDRLGVKPDRVTMIGDNCTKDILSALEAGLNAIWFNPGGKNSDTDQRVEQVGHLKELRFLFTETGQP
ncbi:HAD family hydrolase [Vibrio hannami]|uniref:HAD family hydrolase n=1 Tax=Vibrio hannami TaxID=2717094 RepID=UPI00240EFFB1|nr:HAD family hydrolase [Vibrio hannami]MDG3085232.1 HAD family hydrolase [Vibrio hannami]